MFYELLVSDLTTEETWFTNQKRTSVDGTKITFAQFQLIQLTTETQAKAVQIATTLDEWRTLIDNSVFWTPEPTAEEIENIRLQGIEQMKQTINKKCDAFLTQFMENSVMTFAEYQLKEKIAQEWVNTEPFPEILEGVRDYKQLTYQGTIDWVLAESIKLRTVQTKVAVIRDTNFALASREEPVTIDADLVALQTLLNSM